ncbi:MAG TPA: hypothetical protein VK773_10650 [Acidimicrobiales bacterium]|nr:hypothetical protein [Acidimicrobiales bacterium]
MTGPATPGRPARHELHPLELLSMAWRTFKAEPGRVVVPALVIFALDALQGTIFTQLAVDHLGLESVAFAFVYGASTLGLTFYSGMLERMVGGVERNERLQPIGEVLRTLPWVRLFLADVVLLVVGGVAALFVVLPGLVIDTVFALVGPLINLLGSTVRQAFRRSVLLVWPHFVLVFCFVAIPLAVEHEVLVLVHELVPHEAVGLVFLSTFVVGTTFGIGLGLTEVSLAERLVRGAHGPGQGVRSEDVELPDSMA